jgi:N-acetylmuramoyl-L-alanine amidase
MTSCLVELGFITSEADNKLYDEKLDEYAKAIADAIEMQLNNKS